MTEIFKIIGVALITTITTIILKCTKPELSIAVMITGIIIILFYLLDMVQGALAVFSMISNETGVENGLLKLLLKIVGVGYLTEFGAGILTDFGSASMADKVALGGKVTILILSLPILESLLTLVRGFLQLV